jgi:hypothetical protein
VQCTQYTVYTQYVECIDKANNFRAMHSTHTYTFKHNHDRVHNVTAQRLFMILPELLLSAYCCAVAVV